MEQTTKDRYHQDLVYTTLFDGVTFDSLIHTTLYDFSQEIEMSCKYVKKY